jgi:hypothetical protein
MWPFKKENKEKQPESPYSQEDWLEIARLFARLGLPRPRSGDAIGTATAVAMNKILDKLDRIEQLGCRHGATDSKAKG